MHPGTRIGQQNNARAHHQALRRPVLARQRLKTPAFFQGDLDRKRSPERHSEQRLSIILLVYLMNGIETFALDHEGLTGPGLERLSGSSVRNLNSAQAPAQRLRRRQISDSSWLRLRARLRFTRPGAELARQGPDCRQGCRVSLQCLGRARKARGQCEPKALCGNGKAFLVRFMLGCS